jgi:hypothetical protein
VCSAISLTTLSAAAVQKPSHPVPAGDRLGGRREELAWNRTEVEAIQTAPNGKVVVRHQI